MHENICCIIISNTKKKSPNFEDTLNRTWYIEMVILSKAIKRLNMAVIIIIKTKFLVKKRSITYNMYYDSDYVKKYYACGRE